MGEVKAVVRVWAMGSRLPNSFSCCYGNYERRQNKQKRENIFLCNVITNTITQKNVLFYLVIYVHSKLLHKRKHGLSIIMIRKTLITLRIPVTTFIDTPALPLADLSAIIKSISCCVLVFRKINEYQLNNEEYGTFLWNFDTYQWWSNDIWRFLCGNMGNIYLYQCEHLIL